MNDFYENLKSLFQKKDKQPSKYKVCWHFLSEMLGEFLLITKEEEEELNKLDDHDPRVLREIIREYVVPHYRYFPPENQEKIKNSLTYYLATNSEKLDWVFASHQIPLDSDYGKFFYSLVWKELYGTDGPDPINPDDYEEDCSDQYIMSLTYSGVLEKKYTSTGEKPSIANIVARLKQNS